jgi:hypothetical protein
MLSRDAEQRYARIALEERCDQARPMNVAGRFADDKHHSLGTGNGAHHQSSAKAAR